MRIAGRPDSLPTVPDVASALSAAAGRLGHRPAVTVLRPDRRDEQGFASLLKWTSKGAHLLELECSVEPGGRVRLDAPAGWPGLAVALATWWVGAALTASGEAEVVVVHGPGATAAGDGEVYGIGDAVDGSPVDVGAGPEPWAVAVQTFPDQPPAPRAEADLVAVDLYGVRWTQAELLERARCLGDDGPLGIDADTPPDVWLPALVRPLTSGQPTVVLAGVGRDAAADEGVTTWR